jgi:hypothetical protein
MDGIATLFGQSTGASLCHFNGMTNCSCLAAEPSWIKIPIPN